MTKDSPKDTQRQRTLEMLTAAGKLKEALKGLAGFEAERALNAVLKPEERLLWSHLTRAEVALVAAARGLVTEDRLAQIGSHPRAMVAATAIDKPIVGQEARITGSLRRWFVVGLLQRGVQLRVGAAEPTPKSDDVAQLKHKDTIRASYRSNGQLQVTGTKLEVKLLPVILQVALMRGPGEGKADEPWRFAIFLPNSTVDCVITWPADLELHADDLLREAMEKCSHPDKVARVELTDELQQLLAEPAEEKAQ